MNKVDKVLIGITGAILTISIIIFTVAFLIKQGDSSNDEEPVAVVAPIAVDSDVDIEINDEETYTEVEDTSTEVDAFGISEDTVLRSKAYRNTVDKYMWFMLSEPQLYDVIKQENRSVFIFRYGFSHGEFRVVAKYKDDKVKCSATDLVNFVDDSYPVLYWDMGSIPEEFMKIYDMAAELGYAGVYRCDATNIDNVILQSSNKDYVSFSCAE